MLRPGDFCILLSLSRKNALVKGAEGYQIDRGATIETENRRSNRHEGCSDELVAKKSWQK